VAFRECPFLRAGFFNFKFRRKEDEEILAGFVVTGAGYGLQCVGLRGRCKV
jgi:hypothetical protein